MKLLRYGPPGKEKPGLLEASGKIRDLSGEIEDLDGRVLDGESLARIAALDPASLPTVEEGERLGPCVGRVGKLVCVGLNYSDHAAEAGMPVPEEPILFMKATTSICGPNDDVELPPGAEEADWEVELAIVIGRRAKLLKSEDEAMDHVAGYCIVNDVSERNYQARRSGQWVKGKSLDSFGPMGPWLVTKDEIADPQKLKLSLTVNGETRQDGTTETMIFGVRHLVWYISQFMTLEPGDVISTGTPPGVGMGMKPPVYLQDGDVMRLSVEGLGVQEQKVRRI